MSSSTLDVEVVRFGTLGIRMDWPAEARLIMSIMRGIEQLQSGQSTYLTDADLATDDND